MDIRDGNLEKIKSAVEMDPDIVTKLIKKDGEDGGDVTMLWQACSLGLLPVVEYLCDVKGVDVNFRNPKGSASCLYIAAQMGFKDCCDILIKKGANVNLARDTDATPLFIATQRNHIEVIKLLIENGADVDGKNNQRSTPFVLACNMGHTACALYLLSHGANAYENSTGMTPLQWAKKEKRKETFATLMETVFLRSFYITITFDCWRRRTAIQRKVKFEKIIRNEENARDSTEEEYTADFEAITTKFVIERELVKRMTGESTLPSYAELINVCVDNQPLYVAPLSYTRVIEAREKVLAQRLATNADKGKNQAQEDHNLVYSNDKTLISIMSDIAKRNSNKIDDIHSVSALNSVTARQLDLDDGISIRKSELLSSQWLENFYPKVSGKLFDEKEMNRKPNSILADLYKNEEVTEGRKTSSLGKSSESPMHHKQSIFVGCLSDDTNTTPVLKPFLRSSKFTGKTVFSEAFLESSMSSPQKHVAKEPPKNENPLCTPGKTNADYFREHGKMNYTIGRSINKSIPYTPHRVVRIDSMLSGVVSPNMVYDTSQSLLRGYKYTPDILRAQRRCIGSPNGVPNTNLMYHYHPGRQSTVLSNVSTSSASHHM